jgi:hypothetical protein
LREATNFALGMVLFSHDLSIIASVQKGVSGGFRMQSHGVTPRFSGRYPQWKTAVALLGALAYMPINQVIDAKTPSGLAWKVPGDKQIKQGDYRVSAVVCLKGQAQKVHGFWPDLYSGSWVPEPTTGGEQLGNVRISEDRKIIFAPSGDRLDCSNGKASDWKGKEIVWYHGPK